jgi:outer membrane receptor protein involved in Fe transport
MWRFPAIQLSRLAFLACALAALPLRSTGAQVTMALADRGPRFLLTPASGGAPVEVDASRSGLLRRPVSLKLEAPTIGRMLAAIEAQTGLKFIYSRAVVSVDRPVGLRADSITVAAALTEILLDTNIDVVVARDGQLTLVKRTAQRPAADTGAVAGRVTDKKTGAAIAGATVVVEGTRLSATTGNDGRYRIAGLVAGTYTVRARYIGYAPVSGSVAVTGDQEATADLALEKSAQQLNEVVTTGTVVPTEVKAVPTPVSVITDSLIALQRPQTVQELIRQAIPTAVSWDYAAYPDQTTISVRGASTLSSSGGQMKIFVDGIEAANPSFAPVDPNSIERMEVIRGPEASAIYGSDAVGGVIQIFTKRGDPTATRPQVDAQTGFGVLQSPYASYGGVLRQAYSATVRGGGSDVSYNLGGGYSHTGDYLPNGEISRQSNPSVYGGMRFARGIVSADVSGRYYVWNNPQVVNPAVSQSGYLFYSKPRYEPTQVENQTVGTRLSVAPTRWWQHTVTVGIDRRTVDLAQTQARLTTPADTLLTISNSSQTKTSIGYNTSLQGPLGSSLSGSLTAGFDHYSFSVADWSTSGALNTTGSIQTIPSRPVSAARILTNNTGYFAQAQLGVRDVLFFTGGLRAEQNTNFGDSLGTPVSPRVGLSYVQPVGQATLKLRGSWGRAIRPPSPGEKDAGVGPLTLANPQLGPERQQGWDAGVDAVFGTRGSLSVTYYNQTAEHLIQYVLLQLSPEATYQWQNVARVKNTGVEVEGALNAGLLRLRGQYGYTRARIAQLDPAYTGDLRVGDQTLDRPKHTGGASLAVLLASTTVAAGLSYVGSWTDYDYLAFYQCFGGTGPCQPTFRDYFIEYPSFAKINASVSQKITSHVSAFVSVDNLTNNQAYEALNFSPVTGRLSTVGFQLHY